MNRRRKHIRPLLALAALGLFAAVASGCVTTSADPERGRALFVQDCGNCHVMSQAGTAGQAGPDLDEAFAAARAAGMNSETIKGVVEPQVEFPRPSTGNPAASMPADIVTGQDLQDVAAYVGKWAGVPGAEPPQVEGGPGAQVFANNGCAGCHTLAAADAGGATGPNLDESLTASVTAEEIEEMIVDPDAEVPAGFSAGVMPSNYGETISSEELEELVQFLLESTPAGEGDSGG